MNTLDDDRVLAAFARLTLARMKLHQPLPGQQWGRQELGLLAEKDTRRRLAVAMIPALQHEQGGLPLLFSTIPQLLSPSDVPWMLEQLDRADGQIPPAAWAGLIRFGSAGGSEFLDKILDAVERHEPLTREFQDLLQVVELGTPRAAALKAHHEKIEGFWKRPASKPLDPPLSARIEQCLEQSEACDLNGWWHLNFFLMLTPDGADHGHETKTDLTELPGWLAADEATRSRIMRPARAFLIDFRGPTDDWKVGDTSDRPTMAGYGAYIFSASSGTAN